MLQEKMLKPLEFEFQGKAGEYFRIWIVNVLLTIVTLGIYSAWAKVRNKQYFYANTILDGSPFEYTASPIAILKGRSIVVVILAVYSLTVSQFPMAKPAFIILFFIFLPWIVMRSFMFNARYSSYRNLNFAFDKSLGESVKTFIGIGLLIPLTLGLIYPYYIHAIQKYRIDHHSFGQLYFRLKKCIKAFYKYYAIGGVMFALGLVAIAIIFQGTLDSLREMTPRVPEPNPVISPNIFLSLLLMTGAYLLVYLFVYAYIRANIFNTVWANTALNSPSAHTLTKQAVPLIAFKGAIRSRDLFVLYLTNTIAIIFSFGLLIPWAKIRLARYRVSHLAISSIADLKTITSVEKEKVGSIIQS